MGHLLARNRSGRAGLRLPGQVTFVECRDVGGLGSEAGSHSPWRTWRHRESSGIRRRTTLGVVEPGTRDATPRSDRRLSATTLHADTPMPNLPPALETLLAHRSIRRFTEAPVPDEHVRLAVAAGQQASTSSNVQAYSMLRVRNQATLEKLVELTGGQTKVARCGAFFVVSGDTRRHRLLAARAGVPYRTRLEGFLVSTIDASLFAQNLCVAFESLGYGICYVGGLRNDLASIRELLRVPEGVYPLFGLCVGVPDEDPAPRPRLAPDAVLHEDLYPDDAVLLAEADAYDDRMRSWYAERGLETTWSQRIEKQFSEVHRTDVAEFYRAQGAELD